MQRSLVDNAADPAQVKRAEEATQLRDLDESNDIDFVMSSAHGRRFVWRILEGCGVFRSIYTGNSKTFHNSGMQDVGHMIMGFIGDVNEEYIFTMMKENSKKGIN